MWLVHSAIPDVPNHARLPARPLEVAKARLTDDKGVFSVDRLSEALRTCSQEHPGMATWLESKLARNIDPAARGLGASMAMTIWMAFSIFAGARLDSVTAEDCDAVMTLLAADEDLRRNDPDALLESDDVIAAQQPEVAKVIRNHLDETLSAYANEIDVNDVDSIYRVLLVETLAISYAIKSMLPGADGPPLGPS